MYTESTSVKDGQPWYIHVSKLRHTSKVQHTPFTLGRHTSFDILTNGVARFVVTDTHTHTDTTDYHNPRRACAKD